MDRPDRPPELNPHPYRAGKRDFGDADVLVMLRFYAKDGNELFLEESHLRQRLGFDFRPGAPDPARPEDAEIDHRVGESLDRLLANNAIQRVPGRLNPHLTLLSPLQ